MKASILIFVLFASTVFASEKTNGLSNIAVNETFLPLITKNDSLLSVEYLKRDLDFLLSRNRLGNTKFSLAVYSLDKDEMVYEKNSSSALTPASLTKLFTTFSSLNSLGKNHFIKTKLYTTDNKFSDSSVDSDIYIVGEGDALFDDKDLDTLIKLIKLRNIKKINGNIYLDQTYFDGIYDRKEYSGDYDRVQNLGAITPFSISRSPSLSSGKYIKSILKKNNIEFNGKVALCELPDFDSDIDFSLLAEFRRPLLELLRITNKRSDNFVAEHLFKINGANNQFSDLDYYSSQELIFRITDSLNIQFNDCILNDGSGLSRRNKLSSRAIVELLANVEKSDYSKDFKSTLSIAGYDGTLKGRLIGTLAAKNCIGKTGTLRDASGLAGYVQTLDGERLVFAFIFNGNSGIRYYKQLEDELVQNLSGFFYFNVAN